MYFSESRGETGKSIATKQELKLSNEFRVIIGLKESTEVKPKSKSPRVRSTFPEIRRGRHRREVVTI